MAQQAQAPPVPLKEGADRPELSSLQDAVAGRQLQHDLALQTPAGE